MPLTIGASVIPTIRNGANVNPSITYPVYYILENPDGSLEKITVSGINSPTTVSKNIPGLYKMYSVGSIDPGTPTSIPGYLPLPQGAVFPLTPRHQFYNASDADINANLNIVFQDMYVDSSMPFGAINPASFITDTTTQFICSAYQGTSVSIANISCQNIHSFPTPLSVGIAASGIESWLYLPEQDIFLSSGAIMEGGGNLYRHHLGGTFVQIAQLNNPWHLFNEQCFTDEDGTGYIDILSGPGSQTPLPFLYTLDVRNINNKYFFNYVLPGQRNIIDYNTSGVNISAISNQLAIDIGGEPGGALDIEYYDGWIYRYFRETTPYRIWRFKPDGTEASYININASAAVGDSGALTLVVVNDQFYINGFAGADLYRIDSLVPWVGGSTATVTQTGSGRPFATTMGLSTSTYISNVATTFSSKSVDKSTATLGEELTYSFEVINFSNDIITDVYLLDVLPVGLEFVSGSVIVNGLSYPLADPTSSPGVLLSSSLDVQEGVTAEFKVTIVAPATDGDILINTTDINLIDGFSNPQTDTSNSVSTVVTINPNGDLSSTSKTVNDTLPTLGDTITYTLTLNNTGLVDATNVFIIDTLTSGLSFAGNVTGGTGNPTILPGIDVGTVSPGVPVIVTFDVDITSQPTPNPYSNTAILNYDNGVGATSNNIVGEAIDVQVPPGALFSTSTKIGDLALATVGDIIKYTVNVANTGVLDATNVSVTDPIPVGLSLVPGSVFIDGVLSADNPDTGIDIGNILIGETIVVEFEFSVDSIPTTNPIQNIATIEFTDTNLPNQTFDTPVSITQVDAAIFDLPAKTVDKSFATIGDTLAYQVTLTNSGNIDATSVVVTDSIPTGLNLVPASVFIDGVASGDSPDTGINVGTIIPLQTVVIDFELSVDTIPTINPIENIATIDYSNAITPNKSVNTDQVDTLINAPDFSDPANREKVADKTTVKIGDTITYTITLKNDGTVPANNIVVTDTLPLELDFVSGSTTLNGVTSPDSPITGINIASIAISQTVIVEFTVDVVGIPTINPIQNTANITYDYTVDPLNPNGQSGNDVSSIAETEVLNPILIMTIASDEEFVTIGDSITYTITLENIGNIVANNVTIPDSIPNGSNYIPQTLLIDNILSLQNPNVEIFIPNILPSQIVTIEFQVEIDEIPNPPSTEVNVDYLFTIDPLNPNGESSSSSAPLPDYTVSIADLLSPGSFVKTSDKEFVSIGEIFTYSINITNNGNVPANNVFFIDPLDASISFVSNSLVINNLPNSGNPTLGVNLGTILVNQSITISFNAEVLSIPINNTIENIANVSFDYTVNPLNPNGVSDSGDSTPSQTIVDSPKLIFTQTSSKDFATKGDSITYILTIQNVGNDSANNVTIFNPTPSEFEFIPSSLTIEGVPSLGNPDLGINIGTILPNDTVTITYNVIVLYAPTVNPITTTATTTYTYTVDPLDPNGESGSQDSNPEDVVVNIADIDGAGNFTKTADEDFVKLGDTITYTITILNTGNTSANNAIFTDLLPVELEYIPGTLTINGIPNAGDPNLGINIGIINVSQLVVIILDVIVVSLPPTNNIVNSANVSFDFTLDPSNPNGESGLAESSDSEIIVNSPDFSGDGFIATQDIDFITIDDFITYTFTITNNGNTPANNAILKDILNSSLKFVPGSIIVNNISIPDANPVTGILLGTLNPVDVTIVSLVVEVVDVPLTSTIDNFATLNYLFTIDPSTPNSNSETLDSNIVSAEYVDLNIDIVKSSNKPSGAIAGETIIYTIEIINNGVVDAFNISVTDSLPTSVEFVSDSVFINGVSVPGYSPLTGIPLATVSSGTTSTISFSVLVLNVNNTFISNQASVNFDYQLNINDPINNRTIRSNVLNTKNLIPNINVEKSANKSIIVLGDTITYTIIVTNTGQVDLIDLELKDPLNNFVEYIGNLIIGGIPSTGNITQGVNIGNLQINQSISVLFDTKLVSIPTQHFIENTATVNYEYNL